MSLHIEKLFFNLLEDNPTYFGSALVQGGKLRKNVLVISYSMRFQIKVE